MGTSSIANHKFYRALGQLHGPWCKQPLSIRTPNTYLEISQRVTIATSSVACLGNLNLLRKPLYKIKTTKHFFGTIAVQCIEHEYKKEKPRSGNPT